jgi:LmbE family N-acetylglucosaminyl deacetylase
MRSVFAVISPHLDDAVFSCGRLLAAHPGSYVITVFAGRPRTNGPLLPWDRAAGFAKGQDVVGARREEDRAALAMLGAKPLWLDFVDAQYGVESKLPDIRKALAAALRTFAVRFVFFPLGLFHSDHRLVRRAAATLARRESDLRWFAYSEAIYRGIPGVETSGIESLRRAGFIPRRARLRLGASSQKRRATQCYASQLRALAQPGYPGTRGLSADERYWRLLGVA